MGENEPVSIAEAASRVAQLEAELEVSSEAGLGEDSVARARRILHDWVDTVSGVVSTPGVGRVVLIHADGGRTSISSPKLPFLLCEPVRWEKD